MSETNPWYPPKNHTLFDYHPTNSEILKKSLNDIDTQFKPSTISPYLQNQVIQKHTGQPVNNNQSIGRVLMNHKPSHEWDKSIFYDVYLDKNLAHRQHLQTQANTEEILKKFYNTRNPPRGSCRTFLPMRIYHNMSPITLPLIVFENGEIHPTNKVPDLTLNFLPEGGNITLTSCPDSNQKLRGLQLVVTILYSMTSIELIQSLDQFFDLYTQFQRIVYHQERSSGVA
jgi:hypothetical protein